MPQPAPRATAVPITAVEGPLLDGAPMQVSQGGTPGSNALGQFFIDKKQLMKAHPPKLNDRSEFWAWYKEIKPFGDLHGLFIVPAEEITHGKPMGPD